MLLASAIQDAPGKIAALRLLAYEYALVGQKATAASVRSQASQIVKNMANDTEKSRLLAEIAQQQRNLPAY